MGLSILLQRFDSAIGRQSFALLVKWHNTGFVIRGWQFDSVRGHQSFLGVAQSGSASGLGPEGRRFEPCRRDQSFIAG